MPRNGLMNCDLSEDNKTGRVAVTVGPVDRRVAVPRTSTPVGPMPPYPVGAGCCRRIRTQTAARFTPRPSPSGPRWISMAE